VHQVRRASQTMAAIHQNSEGMLAALSRPVNAHSTILTPAIHDQTTKRASKVYGTYVAVLSGKCHGKTG
jgi:hypothetical protein